MKAADLPSLVRLAGLPEPALEATFAPGRRWRWDLSWPDYRVAVEIQGGVWTGGRHTRGKGYTNDCAKLCQGQLLGWLVLWVTTDQVRSGEALATVERALALRGWRRGVAPGTLDTTQPEPHPCARETPGRNG